MVDVLTEGDKELLQNIDQKIFELTIHLVEKRRRLLDSLVGKNVTYRGKSSQVLRYEDNTLVIKNKRTGNTCEYDLRKMDMSQLNLTPQGRRTTS